jgi:hypothetical protein
MGRWSEPANRLNEHRPAGSLELQHTRARTCETVHSIARSPSPPIPPIPPATFLCRPRPLCLSGESLSCVFAGLLSVFICQLLLSSHHLWFLSSFDFLSALCVFAVNHFLYVFAGSCFLAGPRPVLPPTAWLTGRSGASLRRSWCWARFYALSLSDSGSGRSAPQYGQRLQSSFTARWQFGHERAGAAISACSTSGAGGLCGSPVAAGTLERVR